MMTWIENNMAYLVIGLAVAVVVLFILCIVLFVKFNGQKKKYDYFMGANRRPSHNLEMKIQDYYETSKRIEEKYSKLWDEQKIQSGTWYGSDNLCDTNDYWTEVMEK